MSADTAHATETTYTTAEILPKTFGLYILYTNEWDKAIAFYRDTLEWNLLFEHANGWAEFETAGIRFALHGSTDAVAALDTHLSFFVKDVDESIAALKDKGIEITKQPETVCEGTRCASFADPFGNQFHLTGK
jgi:predicted enzyme related to lactoylglutathione lyase